jgi:hypothetical protein
MPSIEKRIISAILSKIRERHDEPLFTTVTVHTRSTATVSPAKIREADFSDFKAVRELKRRWGLVPDSFENWERLWLHNPALQQTQHTLPIGWVLEAEGRVVGYLGNIASSYAYGGRTLLAVTGHALVVEPAHRAVSLTLNAAFYRQKFVDLYLSTTAIAVVGKIARIFKSDALPQPDYEVLFWVLQPGPFAKHVMEKLQLRPALSAVGGMLASTAVRTDKIFRRRWPRRGLASLEIKETSIAEIGDDFAALWAEKNREGGRLLADRSPGTLRWHFQTPGDRGHTRLLSCRARGELRGYAIVRSDPDDTAGLRRSVVADLIARNDDPATLNALCVAAYDHSKHAGSHILEVLGFPQSVRGVCSQWNPYFRKYPSCPFYYKAADPILHQELLDDRKWYASPFDGDTTLMPILGTSGGDGGKS